MNKNLTPTQIAKAVQYLSDFYIEYPDLPTPWKKSEAQIAYQYYYAPLNYVRATRVVQQGRAVDFFQKIQNVIEFGSGLGSATEALLDQKVLPIGVRFHCIEDSEFATAIHRRRTEKKYPAHSTNFSWSHTNPELKENTLAVFSYSLTELKQIPTWAFECEALMILEPATEDDGRRLLQLREKLLASGFTIWAPCTHQGACPLLNHSLHDWCHDRVHFKAPAWFAEIEAHLPIKNKTLTVSYLLARKSKPKSQPANRIRVVGDQLVEKGKTRQLICQNEERTFLTWMHRHFGKQAHALPEIPRGSLIDLPENLERKSNELRTTQAQFASQSEGGLSSSEAAPKSLISFDEPFIAD